MKAQQIIDFWFEEIDSKKWFAKDELFDQEITKRFLDTHIAASKGELFSWRAHPEGRLAEIIVLDQFSRNIFRDRPQAFAQDTIALVLSQEAVSLGADESLPVRQKSFLYMPYMHSESQVIHEEAVKLFSQVGLEYNLDFELKHKAIIDRFGRYPHRNKILNRTSTEEELVFLTQPGSGF